MMETPHVPENTFLLILKSILNISDFLKTGFAVSNIFAQNVAGITSNCRPHRHACPMRGDVTGKASQDGTNNKTHVKTSRHQTGQRFVHANALTQIER